ncbi:MAG: glycosyltransferase [Proteobacteria bacterium]|nr:glycosyltransferase [Pseudomonadota bacterium]
MTLSPIFNIFRHFKQLNISGMPDVLSYFGLISLAIYAIILLILISGCLRLRNHKSHILPRISVVVAARNEEKNLGRCLRALLSQTYLADRTQIVVVNDRSTDNTAVVLEEHRRQHSNFELVTIPSGTKRASPKKYALSKAISKASGDLIFTTDADCTPSPEWLADTVPLFGDNVGMVVGPAPFEEKDDPWNRVLALDNLANAVVSAGTVGWNIGATCTGRNLAYRKEAFEEVGGFSEIEHSLSGDDDLLLQQLANRTTWKMTYALNPKVAVPSPAASGPSQFIRQRRRHVSAAKHYSRPLQASYLLFNLCNTYLFSFWIFSLFLQQHLPTATALLAMKICLDFLALAWMANKLGQNKLLAWIPLWELFFLINQTFISPLGLVGKVKWK